MALQPHVLIVGAGPVGLTAALVLAEQGIPIRLIDSLPHRMNQSRAAIVHARTLELFERLGVVDAFLGEGLKAHGIHIMDLQGRTLMRPNLDSLPSAYNFLLAIGQDATERLLTEALAQRGWTIERGVTLTALTQTPNGVTATLTHADQGSEEVAVPYVLGCDGARSTVRHQLGLKLEGETLDVYWVTADVRMEWNQPADELVAIPGPDGFGFASPLPGGRWRVVVDMGQRPAVLPETVPLEEVQAACQRVGLRARLSDPVWISPFGVNTRLVPTLQVGRVFLAGDAAHVHSPVGGQGMNTGIQDAINLAWKLALVLKGRGTQELLHSYNHERHANARRLLNFVGPATRMVNLRQPVAVELRRLVMLAVSELGLTSLLARRVSELDVQYCDSPVVAEHRQTTAEWLQALAADQPHPGLGDCWDFHHGPHPGERAPDAQGLKEAAGQPKRLYEHWIGDGRHQLLAFAGRQPSPQRLAALQQLAQGIEHDFAGVIRARVVCQEAPSLPASSLIDAEGDAHRQYGARYECMYLIRPDAYVGFRAQAAEARPLREYLSRVLGAPTPAWRPA